MNYTLKQQHMTVISSVVECLTRDRGAAGSSLFRGELRLSGNHTVTEYEMSGKPYSQKSGLKNHTNERMFQVMTRFDQVMAPSVN